MPGSPDTTTMLPTPAWARDSACSIVASWWLRPTSWRRLVVRALGGTASPRSNSPEATVTLWSLELPDLTIERQGCNASTSARPQPSVRAP
jgi:hypothetical protein